MTTKHLFTTLITTFEPVNNSNRINYIDQVVTQDDLFGWGLHSRYDPISDQVK